MSDFNDPQSAGECLHLADLALETREALAESARSNGRTIDEEAEHIIKTHLAASDEIGN